MPFHLLHRMQYSKVLNQAFTWFNADESMTKMPLFSKQGWWRWEIQQGNFIDKLWNEEFEIKNRKSFSSSTMYCPLLDFKMRRRNYIQSNTVSITLSLQSELMEFRRKRNVISLHIFQESKPGISVKPRAFLCPVLASLCIKEPLVLKRSGI